MRQFDVTIAEKPTKRFHVRCWGHASAPDLDYESDEYDEEVCKKYPCISVALQVPILHSALVAALTEAGQ